MGINYRKRGTGFREICTKGGCANETSKFCNTCGFWPAEAKRRKDIPLTRCGDGLRRKIIRRARR